MKHYQILASYTVYCSMDVEAENEDEAREIAYNADGGDFSTDEHGDWNIDNIIEVKAK